MSKNIPKISIVILNFNWLEYLKKTLSVITYLNYSNKEIIIVDNWSQDGSLEYINSFQNIKLINNWENLWYSKWKNIWVKYASWEYILLLDNDILIDKNIHLYDLIDFFQINNYPIISIPLKDSDKNYISYKWGYINYFTEWFFVKSNSFDKSMNITSCNVAYPNWWAIFFQKIMWNILWWFDESQSFNIDDRDLWIRAYLYGYKVMVYDKFYFEHLWFNHKFNFDTWIWKFKLEYSGNIRIIIKNLKIYNLIICVIILTIYTFLKAIKQSLLRKSSLPIFAFLSSFFLFIKNLPDTLKQRKIIQSRRVIKKDIFLKLKPPIKKDIW